MKFRHAEKADAFELAELINLAGEGIPAYVWQIMTHPGETAMDVGRRRAARAEGGFSYRNAQVCVDNGSILGMVISYRQPDPYDINDLSDVPNVVVPLIQLESQAPGSWYINGIATFDRYRGQGIASQLMAIAEQTARTEGCSELSLIVASDNIAAKKLYEKLGYTTIARKPMVAFTGWAHDGDWLLMVKPISPLKR